jgi:hypothetical protein
MDTSSAPNSVFVLFQEYARIGMMRCAWSTVLENFTQLACADENGFVAATRDLDGVITVDVEESGDATVLAVEAWGVLVDPI